MAKLWKSEAKGFSSLRRSYYSCTLEVAAENLENSRYD
jgi:hypothetical protein